MPLLRKARLLPSSTCPLPPGCHGHSPFRRPWELDEPGERPVSPATNLCRTKAVASGLRVMSIVTARPAEGEVLLDRLAEEGVAVAHECGGKLACSSCQIIVREGAERLSAASEDELDMLERAAVEDPNARLACQAVSKGGEILVEVPDPAIPARALG